MPAPDESADLLRRLLDHDRDVEVLEAEVAAATAELAELKKRLAAAVKARAKLSRDLRTPKPLLADAGVAGKSDRGRGTSGLPKDGPGTHRT
jgi:C4-dicarboxylate-specific signal transduction histidine kinase